MTLPIKQFLAILGRELLYFGLRVRVVTDLQIKITLLLIAHLPELGQSMQKRDVAINNAC